MVLRKQLELLGDESSSIVRHDFIRNTISCKRLQLNSLKRPYNYRQIRQGADLACGNGSVTAQDVVKSKQVFIASLLGYFKYSFN